MGYYTNYKVRIVKGELPSFERETIDRKITTLEKLVCVVLDNEPDWLFGGNATWYEHVDDMLKVSKAYPDVTFELHGVGEEQGDTWKKYFKNGTFAEIYPEIVWKEFNDNMLIEPV